MLSRVSTLLKMRPLLSVCLDHCLIMPTYVGPNDFIAVRSDIMSLFGDARGKGNGTAFCVQTLSCRGLTKNSSSKRQQQYARLAVYYHFAFYFVLNTAYAAARENVNIL